MTEEREKSLKRGGGVNEGVQRNRWQPAPGCYVQSCFIGDVGRVQVVCVCV